MGIPGIAQQVYSTAALTASDTTVYTPPLVAVWITTAGNLVVHGRGDAANSGAFAVPVGLFTFPYPVDKIAAASTAVLGIGVQAGS